MSYVDSNLRNGEVVVLKAKKNPLALARSTVQFILFIVLGIIVITKLAMTEVAIGVIAFGAIIFTYDIVKFCTMVLAVTNKRVIGKVGILKRSVLDYPIDKVVAVALKSTVFGTLFRYQTVSIASANEKAQIRFTGISNANEFKNTVTDAIEKYQEEARRKQAEEIAVAMRKSGE